MLVCVLGRGGGWRCDGPSVSGDVHVNFPFRYTYDLLLCAIIFAFTLTFLSSLHPLHSLSTVCDSRPLLGPRSNPPRSLPNPLIQENTPHNEIPLFAPSLKSFLQGGYSSPGYALLFPMRSHPAPLYTNGLELFPAGWISGREPRC